MVPDDDHVGTVDAYVSGKAGAGGRRVAPARDSGAAISCART